ncbi:MAG: hypothetical protein AB7O56_02665 [Bauldia sp.]
MSILQFNPLNRATPRFDWLAVLASTEGIRAGDRIERTGPDSYRLVLDISREPQGTISVTADDDAIVVTLARNGTCRELRRLDLAPNAIMTKASVAPIVVHVDVVTFGGEGYDAIHRPPLKEMHAAA